jgi:hypothetical protein
MGSTTASTSAFPSATWERGSGLKMIPFNENYQLPKLIWTEADFDQMGWHDVKIHAITFVPEVYEFVLDIDYIFAWVEPEPPSPCYSFWISPATLVFRNIPQFQADFSEPLDLQILGIERKDPRVPRNAIYIKDKTEWTWTIDLDSVVTRLRE